MQDMTPYPGETYVTHLVQATDAGTRTCDHANRGAQEDYAACERKVGERCVDLRTSHANCGGCGVACAENEECARDPFLSSIAYKCLQCRPGRLACQNKRGGIDQCVDVQSNVEHCGKCGYRCNTPYYLCRDGQCIQKNPVYTSSVQVAIVDDDGGPWNRTASQGLVARFRFVDDIGLPLTGKVAYCITATYKDKGRGPDTISELRAQEGDALAAKNCAYSTTAFEAGIDAGVDATVLFKRPVELVFDVNAADPLTGWIDFEVSLFEEVSVAGVVLPLAYKEARKLRPPRQHFRCSSQLGKRPADCAP